MSATSKTIHAVIAVVVITLCAVLLISRFAGRARLADLTLADYWGVGTRFPARDDNRGTSLVLVNTAAGDFLLHAAGTRLLNVPGDLDHAIAHNPFIVRAAAVPPWRRAFFERFGRTGSVSAASRAYVRAGFLLKRRCARTVKQAIWMVRGLLRPRLSPAIERPETP